MRQLFPRLTKPQSTRLKKRISKSRSYGQHKVSRSFVLDANSYSLLGLLIQNYNLPSLGTEGDVLQLLKRPHKLYACLIQRSRPVKNGLDLFHQ